MPAWYLTNAHDMHEEAFLAWWNLGRLELLMPNFTTMTSENCAALSQRLFSLVGDVFNETVEKSNFKVDKLMEIKKSVMTKNGLYYLLKNSATIVMSSYLGEGDDNNVAEVEKFIHYLELNRETVFADAVYAINKSRRERLRMPEQRADDKQVIALKMHTEQGIKAHSDATSQATSDIRAEYSL